MEWNEIRKVEDFFHDGSIDHIEQVNNNIYMWMESAQLRPEWVKEFQVHVNDDMRIKGVLHLINVKRIIVNDVALDEYKMEYDTSDILDFYVSEHQISLLVIWRTKHVDDWQKVIIEAESIYWRYDEYVRATRDRSFESSYNPHELG